MPMYPYNSSMSGKLAALPRSLLLRNQACVENGKPVLFYHDIRKKSALNYMWPVNNGTIYLIGYVPVEAIQQEGRTVNQNILIVVMVMLVAFILCCILYCFNQRQPLLQH